MRILVTVSSRHGATAELATEIGRILRETLDAPVTVDVQLVREVDTVEPYEVVILGSAIYLGHWLDEAAQFARGHAATLRQRAVWLFSSGPVGDVLGLDEDVSAEIDGIVAAIGARDHRVFAGKIDLHHLRGSEHTFVQRLRVPQGDYRDWAAVRTWAGQIARDLEAGRRLVPAETGRQGLSHPSAQGT